MTAHPTDVATLLLEVVVVAFAAFRITRFIVLDSLAGASMQSGSGFSIRLDEWAFTPEGVARGRFRGFITDLLTCTWCCGWWVALACSVVWWVTPAWWLLIPWAIAGAAALLMSFSNMGGD